MHTGIQQVLLHVVQFVFYVFLIYVAHFRSTCPMHNKEPHVFLVLSIPHHMPAVQFLKNLEFLAMNTSVKEYFINFLLFLYNVFA
jgi:hypothetical protein